MADKEKATAFQLSYFVDGEEFLVQTVEKGTRLGAGPKPKKEFHTFSGWDKIPSRMPARDVVVNGTFIPGEYQLRFLADGKELSCEKLSYGAPVLPPEAPALEGRSFLEWSNLPVTMPGEDTDVVAVYEAQTYHVNYVIKDGNGNFGDTTFTFPCLFGEPVPDMDIPQKKYYSFSGWSERPATMPAEDITVTGTLAMTLYKLTRIVDGEVFKEEYLPYGAPVSKKPNPEKEGYYFSGFRKLPKVMPDHDVEVVSSMYPARYKADFFIDEILYDSKYIPFGYPVEFTPELKKGYVFEGWTDCPETMPAADIEVHGKMTRSEFQLIYRARGREVHTDTYAYGEPVVAADPVDMPGFVFLGWKDVPLEMPNHDMYIDGEYRFAANRVSFILEGQQYATLTGDEIVEPIPEEREGYTFDGWKETVLEEDGSLSVSGKYVRNVHTVSYEADGEVVATETLAFGEALTAPEGPSKENKTFIGWKDIPETMPDRDLTLAAEYTEAVYRIEFVIDGTIVAEFVKPAGAEINAPEVPAKEGYAFAGWLNAPEQMPAYDIVINGEYAPVAYKLTYMLDGELYSEVTLSFGDDIEAPTPESKDGQSFTGWENLPATMPASDVTVNGYMGSQVYTVRFMVDGELYGEARFAEGVAIVAPEQVPVKEGYSFLQWTSLPEVMPASDIEVEAEFAINEYNLVFTVAEKEIAKLSFVYGAEVKLPEDIVVNDPAFDGWLDLPAVMPAHDVTVIANLNRASYVLTYTVDGEVVKEQNLYPDDEVVCPEVAQREGYTFAGWRGYMEKMPAHDLEIVGFYMPNSHVISYMVDGELFTYGNALFGTTPVVPAIPEKDGFRFVGFEGLPAEMPDQDIVVNAQFEASEEVAAIEEIPEGACTVRFTASGVTVAKRYVMPGFSVEAPKAPYKYGYSFVKWDSIDEEIETDTEVRAHYKPNAHHVLYLKNNIVCMDQVVNYGDLVIVPEQMVDANVIGWKNIPATMPDTNVVVTAVLANDVTAVTYTVNGELFHQYYANIGEAPVVPTLPDKIGYTLVSGWENIPEVVGAEALTFDAKYEPKLHNVIFMCCGEEVFANKVPYGASIELPEFRREIEGILYEKWGECPETMPDGDVVVHAVGRACGGVVTYMCEGNVVATVRYTEAAELKGPEMPERIGYTFDGWKAQPATMPNEDITVCGEYVPNLYTITYKVKGMVFKEEQYPYGASITPSKAPIIKKRSFVTWSGLPSVMPAENIVTEGLYNTQNTFLLSFRINGEPYAESVLEPGTRILMPQAPVKEGYVFSGWDKTVTVIGREPIIVNGTMTPNVYTVVYYVGEEVYAKYDVAVGDPIPVPAAPETELTFCGWSALPKEMPSQNLEAHANIGVSYDIVFMADGCKIAEYTLLEKEAVTIPEAPEKEGFRFVGWDNLPEVASANVVCTALYAPCSYKATFTVGGEVYAEREVVFGLPVDLPDAPQIEGKTFGGWANLPEAMPASDITVAATFDDIPVYILTFVADGETVSTATLYEGDVISAPEAPAKEGYTFVAWENLCDKMPAQDLVVTATYEAIPVYTLAFVADEATVSTATLYEGDAIIAPEAPAKEGYTFAAWENLCDKMPAQDLVITATYTENPVYYTVTFIADGETVSAIELLEGASIEAPTAPEKVGYTFKGWGEVPATATENATFTAIFEQNVYTVQYTVDGELYASAEVLFGEAPSAVAVPEKEGFEFKGWENLPEVITESIVCNALFEEVAVQEVAVEETVFEVPEITEPAPVYVLTYLVGGEVYASYELEEGKEVVIPEAPATDLTFVGWNNLPELMPAQDVTVEAELGATYNVVFKADDVVVAEFAVKEGEPILAPEAPAKEGHAFICWNALTETASADLECAAVYETKTYTVSYTVDGEVIATFTTLYGTELPALQEVPAKDGMNFIGWGEVPATMPAYDVALEAVFEEIPVKKVTVIFKLDGNLFYTAELVDGEELVCPAVDSLANRIFMGWGEVPATVCATEDGAPLVIEGFSKPITHNVTYMVNDVVYAVIAAPVGEPIELPGIPHIDEMRFEGWEDLPEVMPDSDVTLKAIFVNAKGSVSFYVDGRLYNTQTLTKGEAIKLPIVPGKDGYTFSGFGEVPETLEVDSLSFEGNFVRNVHKIKFYVGKKLYAEEEIAFASPVQLPGIEPKHKKLTFMGWEETPVVMPDNDVVVHAIFKRTTPVEYHVDGAVYKVVYVPVKETIPALVMPTKEGYTFSGWSKYPKKARKKKIIITGTYSPNTYTLTYMDEKEVFRTVSVKFGEAIEAIEGPAKEHANFLYWNNLPATMPAQDVIANAVFESGRYKVSFILDDINVCEIEQEVGDVIAYPVVPKKLGHTFLGWDDVPSRMPARHLIIRGTYKLNEHAIRFMVGKEVFCEAVYEYGATIEAPLAEPRSKKKKYLFYKWDNLPLTMGDEDIVVNAVFETKRKLKKMLRNVSYYVDGKLYAKAVAFPGRYIERPVDPEKSGYQFEGWENLPERMAAHDIKVHARFIVKECTATFMIDGEEFYSVTLPVGAEITCPTPQPKTGYTFSGWENYAEFMPDYDFIVKGEYKKENFTVTYMANGKIFDEIAYECGQVIVSPIPAETYTTTFVMWQGLPDSMPAQNITVYALFRKKEYKVTYMVDKKVIASNYVAYGNTIIPPAFAPNKRGKVIVDWRNMPVYDLMPTHDVVLEAIWGSEAELRRITKKKEKKVKKPIYTIYEGYLYEEEGNANLSKEEVDKALLDKLVKEECRKRMRRLMR